MMHPSYKEMITKINKDQDIDEAPLVTSRYSIVIAAAKRARQLIAGEEPYITGMEGEKPLSVAVQEIYEGKVHILRDDEQTENAKIAESIADMED
ncbi:MAG TPA: DNA-directed RNA polymerase subunit omega [Lachnospiraceae bacterium]|nr:DNA-directed RNA polymerase subunit omega [Lachnospiraceae bacterium]